MIKLYHGSTLNIQRIDLTKSRPNKDFGQGFYLSADHQQAWRMGEFKALTEGGTAVMNTYLFDESIMTSGDLKVLTFDGYTPEDMTDFQVTDQEFNYQKEQLTAKMIQILVEEQGCDLETAIDCVYSSDIYKKLSDRRTGLFFQSPRYVLSFLKEELTPKE